MAADSAPHSADQFGAQRDFWWNKDFVDLMATRWRLHEATSLADIGCGLCHWSRLLYPYLKQPARFTAVDREAEWITKAQQLFRKRFSQTDPALFTFVQGSADSLPLPDNSFDVVTCQTVLMHLRAPQEALREMTRVARPGGLVVCVEPNNFWNYLSFTSLTAEESVDEMVRRFEFWLRYHRGITASGRGDHSIGDRLPGYFAELGLRDISVFQSDRVPAIFPPYASPEQQTLLEDERKAHESSRGLWDREQLRRDVSMGGGTSEFFDRVFAELQARFDREQAAIRSGRFHAAYGGLSYLVSGRKAD